MSITRDQTGSVMRPQAQPAPPPQKQAVPGRTDRSAAADIGPLFRDLRRCLRLSLPELARRLETKVDTIEALERGDFGRLPSWAETVRVVTSFTMLANIDPRPVLQVMADEIGARRHEAAIHGKSANQGRAAAFSKSRLAAIRGLLPALQDWLGGGMRQMVSQLRWPDAVRLPIRTGKNSKRPARLALVCAVLAALVTSLVQSPMLQASVTGGAIGRVFDGLKEYVLKQSAVKKDGMVWIDVDDPRSRRTDKLQVE